MYFLLLPKPTYKLHVYVISTFTLTLYYAHEKNYFHFTTRNISEKNPNNSLEEKSECISLQLFMSFQQLGYCWISFFIASSKYLIFLHPQRCTLLNNHLL